MNRVRSGWRAQLLLFAAAYGVYNVARWIFVGDLSTATLHADWIIHLEQAMGVAVEASVQRTFDHDVPMWLLSNVYLAAQLVVPPAAFIWLYRRSPRVYRVLRDTVLATWLIAIPIYALFPVAPPRLAEPGVIDAVSRQAAVALTGRSTIFYNPLAAVPSLHVGFAAAISIALAASLRSRWAKALALLWAPTVALAVVATGNHYIFDVAAGLLVTVAGFAAARLADRLRRSRGRPAGDGGWPSEFAGKGMARRADQALRRSPPAAAAVSSATSGSASGWGPSMGSTA
jgi:membrane-associated phospholipid phosphatase